MNEDRENKFKACGYGKPNYDREGDYDEVWCGHPQADKGFCHDIKCPLEEDL